MSDGRRGGDDVQSFVVETVQTQSASLLRVAQRYSYCRDDAGEAYQRALEIFLRRAGTLDRERAHGWLHKVVKHEALAVRRERQRDVSGESIGLEALEARDSPGPDEQALTFETVARSAEALRRLKPQEVRALWLRAQGHSYNEIAELCDWSYTKVNRCLTEGRRAFLERYAGIESGEECRRWEGVLSALADGEASAADLTAVRPHLRNCPACRSRLHGIQASRAPLALVFPVALVAGGDPRDGEAASNLLVRAYEALAGGLQERAVASVTKLQTAVEGATASKAAAVAASAAALAGGGAVVAEERAQGAKAPPPSAQERPARSSAAWPLAAPPRAPGPQPARASATKRADDPGARPRPREHEGTSREGEFSTGEFGGGDARSASVENGASAPPPASAPSAPGPPASGGGGEFDGAEFGG